MPEEKLNVKIQIRLSEENKENLDKDLAFLAKQVKKQTGTVINRSDFLRLVLEDLHEKVLLSNPIVWPPRLETKHPRSGN